MINKCSSKSSQRHQYFKVLLWLFHEPGAPAFGEWAELIQVLFRSLSVKSGYVVIQTALSIDIFWYWSSHSEWTEVLLNIRDAITRGLKNQIDNSTPLPLNPGLIPLLYCEVADQSQALLTWSLFTSWIHVIPVWHECSRHLIHTVTSSTPLFTKFLAQPLIHSSTSSHFHPLPPPCWLHHHRVETQLLESIYGL